MITESLDTRRTCEEAVFLDNSGIFFYFSIKTYILGAQKFLTEALLMSVHKICFYGEMAKVVPELLRILNITVLSTSLGRRVFAWRFILNENIFFFFFFFFLANKIIYFQ